MRPVLQVGRGEQAERVGHVLVQDDEPLLGRIVPDQVRVAVQGGDVADDRVAVVPGPGPTAVGAVGQELAERVLGRGVHQHQRRLAADAEPAAVLPVDHGRPGPARPAGVGRQGDRQLRPVGQVLADRVAPRHHRRLRQAVRVVLEETGATRHRRTSARSGRSSTPVWARSGTAAGTARGTRPGGAARRGRPACRSARSGRRSGGRTRRWPRPPTARGPAGPAAAARPTSPGRGARRRPRSRCGRWPRPRAGPRTSGPGPRRRRRAG